MSELTLEDLVPCFQGVALKPHGVGPMSPIAELEPVAAKIRGALANL